MHSLPFGKYKNHLIQDVPTDYLKWLLGQGRLKSGLKRFIASELEKRRAKESIAHARLETAKTEQKDTLSAGEQWQIEQVEKRCLSLPDELLPYLIARLEGRLDLNGTLLLQSLSAGLSGKFKEEVP